MNASYEEVQNLATVGVSIKEGINSYILYENDLDFNKKFTELAKISASPDNCVEYSKEEFNSSKFFNIELSQQQGYPKPESKYKEIFYDAKYRTEEESYLLVQTNDISAGQISKSIKGLFGINWLFVEVFADKSTYEKFIKPLGIKSRRVLNGTRKQEMENIVQLLPQGVSPENLKSDFEYETIGKNKRIVSDYHIPLQGYSDKIAFHFFETKEFFGFKDNTYRLPIISKTFYEILQKNKIKGCRYFPVLRG
ncbi:hypothetical protein [Leptospira harrisiae]|nr:hypothetical protein [Leptospira harrisiae]